MKINNLKTVISGCVLLIFSNVIKTQAQTVTAVNQPGICLNPTDAFNFIGNSVAYYGLGWYHEGTTPPVGYLSGYSGLRFFTLGMSRMHLDINGNLGIGTSNFASRLNIVGGDESITLGDHSSGSGTKGIYFPGFRDVLPNYFGASIEAVPEWACCNLPGSDGYPGIRNMGLNFNVHGNYGVAADKVTAMSITSNGNIGIGIITPKEKLSVNGNIRAKEIKVEGENWPDYVFEKEYQLPDLQSTKQYISANGHLPEMPSAKMIAAEGQDLGDIQIRLLKKVEELTLHLIRLEEMNEKQTQKVAKQDRVIAGLKKIITKTSKHDRK
jgi:hypothetical protein